MAFPVVGVIVRSLQGILKSAVRVGLQGWFRSGLAKVAPYWVSKAVVRAGNGLILNAASRKWWARSIRMFRTSFLQQAGAVGTMLQKAGVNNWLTKGMGAFNYDRRSPKEFARDMERYNREMDALKVKRAEALKAAASIQNELMKIPLDTSGYQTSEEKIDALARGLDVMKRGIGEIRASTSQAILMVDNVNQDVHNRGARIEAAVLGSNQQTLQMVITSSQEMKDHHQGVAASSSQATISEITGHIDAIEETKRAEEERRRKNHWLPKALDKILKLLEIILDFPGFIIRTLLKALAISILFLATKYEAVAAGLFVTLVAISNLIGGLFRLIWNAITGTFNAILGGFFGAIGAVLDGIHLAIDAIPGIDGPWPDDEDNIKTRFVDAAIEHGSALEEDLGDAWSGIKTMASYGTLWGNDDGPQIETHLRNGTYIPQDAADFKANGPEQMAETKSGGGEFKAKDGTTQENKINNNYNNLNLLDTNTILERKNSEKITQENIKIEKQNQAQADMNYLSSTSTFTNVVGGRVGSDNKETDSVTKKEFGEAIAMLNNNLEVTTKTVQSTSAQTQATVHSKPVVKKETNWKKNSYDAFGVKTGV